MFTIRRNDVLILKAFADAKALPSGGLGFVIFSFFLRLLGLRTNADPFLNELEPVMF